MTRLLFVAIVGSLAAALALATRWPSESLAMAAGGLLAVGTVVLGVLSRRGIGRPWTGPLALVAGAALLLLPAGPSPWISLPAVVVALPMLAYFHFLLETDAHHVPRLGGDAPARTRVGIRFLPWALLAGVAVAAPLLARTFLPDRLAFARELQGPAGPLLAAALAGCLVLACAMALRAMRRAPADEPTAGPDP